MGPTRVPARTLVAPGVTLVGTGRVRRPMVRAEVTPVQVDVGRFDTRTGRRRLLPQTTVVPRPDVDSPVKATSVLETGLRALASIAVGDVAATPSLLARARRLRHPGVAPASLAVAALRVLVTRHEGTGAKTAGVAAAQTFETVFRVGPRLRAPDPIEGAGTCP